MQSVKHACTQNRTLTQTHADGTHQYRSVGDMRCGLTDHLLEGHSLSTTCAHLRKATPQERDHFIIKQPTEWSVCQLGGWDGDRRYDL